MKDSMRTLIAGGPRTGKTTLGGKLARAAGIKLRSTDDLIPLGWSEASEAAAGWMSVAGPWVIEGVALPRALRKWLEAHRTGKPADELYWLAVPREERSAGQIRMAAGCETVWAEVMAEVERRGVRIVGSW